MLFCACGLCLCFFVYTSVYKYVFTYQKQETILFYFILINMFLPITNRKLFYFILIMQGLLGPFQSIEYAQQLFEETEEQSNTGKPGFLIRLLISLLEFWLIILFTISQIFMWDPLFIVMVLVTFFAFNIFQKYMTIIKCLKCDLPSYQFYLLVSKRFLNQI